MSDWVASGRRGLIDPRLLALVDQAVVSGCNFITTVILARQLSTESFGLFSLAFMICLFLSNLHRAGLTQPLNVLGSGESHERLAWRLAGLLRVQMILLPLSAIVLAAASLLLFPDAALTLSAIVYFSCFALQETLRRYWYTRVAVREALMNDLLSYGTQVVVLVALVVSDRLLVGTAFLAMGATSLLAFVAGMRRIGPATLQRAQPVSEVVAEHWPMAKWLLLTVLAVWGAGQVYPLLMVPLGAAAVASFAACRNLLNAMGLIVQSVGNYIPTQAAKALRHSGKDVLRRDIWSACAAALLAGVVFLLFIHWYAGPLLHLIYAGRYDHAAPILRTLAFGTVFSLLGAILGAYALAMEDSRSGFLSNLGASVVTFTVGLWLIGSHGVVGASLAAVLSLAVATSLQAMFVALRLRHL